MWKYRALCFFVLIIFSFESNAASVEKAELLSRHGLNDEARVELVDVIFGSSPVGHKAKAYYLLGSIAFQENNISVALDSWTTLVNDYPNSAEGKLVSERLDEMAEIVGESVNESTNNAVASSYIRHGDFWSKGKSTYFSIDSSWIPNVESALKWYNKVIEEFPKSPASRIAYQSKLRTILGWEKTGPYGNGHGVKANPAQYIPLLVAAFENFERDHPDASSLQGFRYQVAQAYWIEKNWDETRSWLNKIIAVSGDRDSFYRDLAQRRLKNVEY